jgi:hypothetical protein
MDEVAFSERGNVVTLVKRREAVGTGAGGATD